jgi:hypothetical protein
MAGITPDVAVLTAQYRSGMGLKKLASLHGCTVTAVRGLLVDAGVAIRAPGFAAAAAEEPVTEILPLEPPAVPAVPLIPAAPLPSRTRTRFGLAAAVAMVLFAITTSAVAAAVAWSVATSGSYGAADLSRSAHAAYDRGLAQGVARGRVLGAKVQAPRSFRQGRAAGFRDGYARGLATGKAEGMQDGIATGFQRGYQAAAKKTRHTAK